jgi:hypothetical protein
VWNGEMPRKVRQAYGGQDNCCTTDQHTPQTVREIAPKLSLSPLQRAGKYIEEIDVEDGTNCTNFLTLQEATRIEEIQDEPVRLC